MVNRSNVLTASRTSSCTDYIYHCCPRTCFNSCCEDQCKFVNDRTYTTLRKICHKIFKDYNRAQCREKYTIFNGGESINVRIHRSGSRGNANNKDPRYQKSNEDHYRLQTKYKDDDRQDTRGDKLFVKKTYKDDKKFNFNVNISNREKAMGDKSKEAGEGVRDYHERRNPKWKSNKHRDELNDNEEHDNNKAFKIKERIDDQGLTKKGNQNYDPDVNDKNAQNVGTKKKGTSRVNKDNFINEKPMGSKSKEAGEEVKDYYERRNPKLRSNKHRDELYDNDELVNDKTLKRKEKFDQELTKKGSRNFDSDVKDTNLENFGTKKKRKSRVNKDNFRNDSESYENHTRKGMFSLRDSRKDEKNSRKFKKLEPNYKDRELIDSKMVNIKNKMAQNKYEPDNEYSDSYDEYSQQRKYKKQNKNNKADDDSFTNRTGNMSKRSHKNLETSRRSINIRTNKYRKSQNFDDIIKSKGKNYCVITNFRSKVRQGTKTGLNNESSFNHISKLDRLMFQKHGSLQYRHTKPTRADEVKACDYLRALMEQRDLCSHLLCSQQSNQVGPHICIPQTCIQNCCANTVISCISGSCKC